MLIGRDSQTYLKIITSLSVWLFLVNFALAQEKQKMSDAEFDGLKGQVKTVIYEDVLYENGRVLRQRGKFKTETTYDKDGNIIEKSNFADETRLDKTSFLEKDGYIFISYKKFYSPLDEEPPSVPQTVDKPVDKGPNLEQRYKFTYDQDQNRVEVIIFRYDEFSKNMKAAFRKTYEYDSNRNKIKEIVFNEDGRQSNATIFRYDSKGLLKEQETVNYDKSKSNYTFVYVKTDKHGNWLERKVFYRGSKKYLKKPKLVEIQYQNLTYH